MQRRSLLSLLPGSLFAWFGLGGIKSQAAEPRLTEVVQTLDRGRLHSLLVPIIRLLPETTRRKLWWDFYGVNSPSWTYEERVIFHAMQQVAETQDTQHPLPTVHVEGDRIVNVDELFMGATWERAGVTGNGHGEKRSVLAWCPASSPIGEAHRRRFHGEVRVEQHRWVYPNGALSPTYIIWTTEHSTILPADYTYPTFNAAIRYEDGQRHYCEERAKQESTNATT